jgi:alpha/beta superfamily hydrolase
LEVLHRSAPDDVARGAAVLCHPHPQYGGNMHERVVFRMARAFHAAGFATLRFNFRGVGLSGGTFDSGEGERDDVRAGLDHLESLQPGVEMTVAGYSFGAWTGLAVGVSDERVKHLVGVGVPLRLFDFDFLAASRKGLLLIQGDRDRFGTPAEVRELGGGIDGGARIVILPEADHFLAAGLDGLERAIGAHFSGVEKRGPGGL